jgi:hypothetical protein
VQLALFGGLWVLLGAMTAWAAAGAIAISPPVSWQRALALSMLSMLKGLVLVAGIALLYVCAVRLGCTAHVLAVHPEDYRPGFDVLVDMQGQHSSYGYGDIIFLIATGLASGVEAIAHAGRWGGLGVAATVAQIIAALVLMVFSSWAAQKEGVFFNGVRLGLGGALAPRKPSRCSILPPGAAWPTVAGWRSASCRVMNRLAPRLRDGCTARASGTIGIGTPGKDFLSKRSMRCGTCGCGRWTGLSL